MLTDNQNNEEEQIITDIYNKHHSRVRQQAKKALRSYEDVEDVVQETFLRVWKYRNKVPEIKNMGAWINTIARTVICDKIKELSRNNYLSLDKLCINEEPENFFVDVNDKTESFLISQDPTPIQLTENQEIRDQIEEALDSMKNPLRKEVWLLKNLEGYKTSEISEKVKKKPEMIRRWNRQTTKEVKAYIEKKGYKLD